MDPPPPPAAALQEARRNSSVDFDNHVVQFHLSYAENNYTDAINALLDLRDDLTNSSNSDATLLGIRKEVSTLCPVVLIV